MFLLVFAAIAISYVAWYAGVERLLRGARIWGARTIVFVASAWITWVTGSGVVHWFLDGCPMTRLACFTLAGLALLCLTFGVLMTIESPRFRRVVWFVTRCSGYLLLAVIACVLVGSLASAIGWIATVLAVGFVVLILVICASAFLIVKAIMATERRNIKP